MRGDSTHRLGVKLRHFEVNLGSCFSGSGIIALVLLGSTGAGLTACMELSDVVDVKAGSTAGIGAKVELTDFVGVGFGLASGEPVETFGRRQRSGREVFTHFGILGADGPDGVGGHNKSRWLAGILLGRSSWHRKLPTIQRFRIGAEIYLFAFNVGFYLNLGEIYDCLASPWGDPSDDDHVRIGTELFEHLEPPEVEGEMCIGSA